MSENQNNPSAMNIDNFALGDNTSNVVNVFPTSRPNETREEYNQSTLPNFTNEVKEALTIVRKFLARQATNHEIKINKDGIFVNGTPYELNYEACKICKHQPSTLACSSCERKVCANCVTKRSQEIQCTRCKNAKKAKNKLASEFEDRIERLVKLESNDKIKEIVLVEVEKLAEKSLEELIEVVRKLEIRSDKLDRSISIAYFYVGKVFYERMEEFFSTAKELDFGKERLTIREIKEKLSGDDSKISRFFNLTLKIFLTYQGFESSEEQIRKAEGVPSTIWLRDLSQEKFLDFLGKLEQRRREEE